MPRWAVVPVELLVSHGPKGLRRVPTVDLGEFGQLCDTFAHTA
ncbi:hypothetical protein [Streptomyces deserti]